MKFSNWIPSLLLVLTLLSATSGSTSRRFPNKFLVTVDEAYIGSEFLIQKNMGRDIDEKILRAWAYSNVAARIETRLRDMNAEVSDIDSQD